MHDFEQLEAWKQGHLLVLDTYRLTRLFLKSERFALKEQMRRAAISIPANIAEGAGIGGRSFIHHLRIAAGSCSELQAEAYLARDLGFASPSEAGSLSAATADVRKIIHGLISSLNSDD